MADNLTETSCESHSAFLARRVGARWAICRNTERNRERYGVCLTPRRYAELQAEWTRENISPELLKALRAVDSLGADWPRFHPAFDVFESIRKILNLYR